MTDHLEILRQHNNWRRGAETKMISAKCIGMAIDAVIYELELLRRGECICKRCGLRQDSEKAKGEF